MKGKKRKERKIFPFCLKVYDLSISIIFFFEMINLLGKEIYKLKTVMGNFRNVKCYALLLYKMYQHNSYPEGCITWVINWFLEKRLYLWPYWWIMLLTKLIIYSSHTNITYFRYSCVYHEQSCGVFISFFYATELFCILLIFWLFIAFFIVKICKWIWYHHVVYVPNLSHFTLIIWPNCAKSTHAYVTRVQ